MFFRPAAAAFAIGAVALLGATPKLPPLKTITHVHSSPLCSGLRRVIGPAISDALQNDKMIATSKPLFHQYVQATARGMSDSAQSIAVARLESLIGPLVKNTKDVDKLLHDPYAFPKVAYTQDDRKLLQMRAQLLAVNEQQKKALDLISGFVDTEQMGQLQAAGHEYDSALLANGTATGKAGPTPTPVPNDMLNAGVDKTTNDPARAIDPRYKNTDSALGANPLNAFEQMMSYYQQDISSTEQIAAKTVISAVPLCGGQVPGTAPSPAPSASP